MSNEENGTVASCASCGDALDYLGIQPIRMGGAGGGWIPLIGNWAESGEWIWDVAVFRCSSCGRFEFYDENSTAAQNAEDAR